jgi:wyosine [tRNA(Phe)-imidazoG37] synthetase (radical SAM superfamily)
MFLFDQLIFGPIQSRRLGVSLGINLLPIDAKICSFDCIYCECGFNTTMQQSSIPTRKQVSEALELKLQQMLTAAQTPDVITFAGNGEPTLHADFEAIIDDTLILRDKYCPSAKVSVLSNSTRIHKAPVYRALRKVDNNILKFDSAIERTMQLIDRPTTKYLQVSWLVEHLKKFEGHLIIQTMFLRGEFEGEHFDNSTDMEVDAWIAALEEIKPQKVMIYTIDRETPATKLEKVGREELELIADKARKFGFEVSVA